DSKLVTCVSPTECEHGAAASTARSNSVWANRAQAERMTDRVEQHPPLVRRGLMLGLPSAQGNRGWHRRIQIVDGEVQVHLLVLRSVRPRWRDIGVDAHQ